MRYHLYLAAFAAAMIWAACEAPHWSISLGLLALASVAIVLLFLLVFFGPLDTPSDDRKGGAK